MRNNIAIGILVALFSIPAASAGAVSSATTLLTGATGSDAAGGDSGYTLVKQAIAKETLTGHVPSSDPAAVWGRTCYSSTTTPLPDFTQCTFGEGASLLPPPGPQADSTVVQPDISNTPAGTSEYKYNF
jgi:hypothetical protein